VRICSEAWVSLRSISRTSRLAVAQAGDRHLPAPLPLAKADQFGAGHRLRWLRTVTLDQPLGRSRVPDGKSHIDTLDMFAKHSAGRRVGVQDAAVADDQQRIVDGFEQVERFGQRGQAGLLDLRSGARMLGAAGQARATAIVPARNAKIPPARLLPSQTAISSPAAATAAPANTRQNQPRSILFCPIAG
jgi:hypothetical protein